MVEFNILLDESLNQQSLSTQGSKIITVFAGESIISNMIEDWLQQRNKKNFKVFAPFGTKEGTPWLLSSYTAKNPSNLIFHVETNNAR